MLDMGNAGLGNVDIPFIGFLINLFKLYYPDMLNSIIVLEMPWIMNGGCSRVEMPWIMNDGCSRCPGS